MGRGLLDADTEGMNHQMIEVPLVNARRRESAVLRRDGARPQAFEPEHAERAGLGPTGERRRGKILDEGHG